MKWMSESGERPQGSGGGTVWGCGEVKQFQSTGKHCGINAKVSKELWVTFRSRCVQLRPSVGQLT